MPTLTRRLAAEVLAREDVLERLEDHLAGGGDGIEFAGALGVSWAALWAWIQDEDHPERRAAWERGTSGAMEWTRQTLLRELRSMSTSDLRQAFDPKGNLLPPAQWPDALARAVSTLDQSAEGDLKIKLWSKTDSIKMLGSTLRMFLEQREQTPLEDTLEALVLRSMQPATETQSQLALPQGVEAPAQAAVEAGPAHVDPPTPHPGVCDSRALDTLPPSCRIPPPKSLDTPP